MDQSKARSTLGPVPRGWFASDGASADLSGPIVAADVELSTGFGGLASRTTNDGIQCAVQLLVRMHGHPIGIVLVAADAFMASPRGVDGDSVAALVWAQLSDAIAQHMNSDGLQAPSELTRAGLPVGTEPPCSWKSRLGGARPTATICIATCGRAVPTLLGTVRSALNQTYDNFEVLVVDNRPKSTLLPGPLLDAFPDEPRLRYVTESRKGLAAVRNRGAREAGTEIVALTDEDVILDPNWLAYLVTGFDSPKVGCVTGLILPSVLETPAQLLIEQFGGFSKGFDRRRWDLVENRLAHPLYPYLLGAYGSGANSAWRQSALADVGGYDESLGTGTRSRGGEDIDIYLTCVRSGWQIVYEPSALVRHEHRREISSVQRQVFDYGVGLGAVLAKHFFNPEEQREMLARLPQGLRYLLRPDSPKNAGKRQGFPRSLTLAELAGIGYGPFAYIGSRRASRRYAKS